jgi:hypothetical protein
MGDNSVSANSQAAATAASTDLRLSRTALFGRGAGSKQQDPAKMADLILTVPPAVEGMTIYAFLLRTSRWGRQRVMTALAVHQIGELTRVGELTPRQRTVLSNLLMEFHDGKYA